MSQIRTFLFRLAIVCAAITFSLPALAQFHFGNWELTHDETQCAARKQTRAGTLLVFTNEPGSGISIIAVNPTWTKRFKKGRSYRAELKFDKNGFILDSNSGSIQIPGRGIGFNAITTDTTKFLRLLAASDELQVYVNGQFLEQFNLEGSDEISRSLQVCDRS
jgi:hypothetical protein